MLGGAIASAANCRDKVECERTEYPELFGGYSSLRFSRRFSFRYSLPGRETTEPEVGFWSRVCASGLGLIAQKNNRRLPYLSGFAGCSVPPSARSGSVVSGTSAVSVSEVSDTKIGASAAGSGRFVYILKLV